MKQLIALLTIVAVAAIVGARPSSTAGVGRNCWITVYDMLFLFV